MGNTYTVKCDFTTVHGSRFIGRSVNIDFETDMDMPEFLKIKDGINQLCVDHILSKKPKWKILMIAIVNITTKKLNHVK